MRSWKTTILGLAAAVMNLVANGAGWKQSALSVFLAFLGATAKDFNVSGRGQ